jgi:hypothetical protein
MELLRRPLDFMQRIAVDGVEQHVFEQRHVNAGGMGVEMATIGFDERIDNPDFVIWLQRTVTR